MKHQRGLLKALQAVAPSACVLSSGVTPPVIPGVRVTGVGPLAFPAVSEQLQRVLELAGQAPFGRGSETVVDTTVRNVWQLEPGQFDLTNPEWQTILDDTLRRVADDFQLQQRIEARLYKLLVYAPGSFFLPHRDTEKADRMFATLVFCLPSEHEGGELVVEHEGQRHEVNFGGRFPFRTQFAAFYADCLHEVKPVRSGYRICLVYNLSMVGERQPRAPQLEPAIPALRRALSELFSRGLSKAAVVLSHEYTSGGLSVEDLKGGDRARFDALAIAAQREELECRLGLLNWNQEAVAEVWDDRYYRGNPRYTVGEIYEESVTVSRLLDPRGSRREKGPWKFSEDELVLPVTGGKLAFKRSIHEATGNEGVSISRWYRTAVAVLWPQQATCEIWAAQGPRQAVPELRKLILRGAPPGEQLNWARAIIASWIPPSYHAEQHRSMASQMLWCLAQLRDPQLLDRFIEGPLAGDYDRRVGPALLRVAHSLGWGRFAPFFEQISPTVRWRSVYLRIFRQLCCSDWVPQCEGRRSLALQVLPSVLKNALRVEFGWRSHGGLTGRDLRNLFASLTALGAHRELGTVAEHFLLSSDLHSALVPALALLSDYRDSPTYEQLWNGAVGPLRQATAAPVQYPSDWASRERAPGAIARAARA